MEKTFVNVGNRRVEFWTDDTVGIVLRRIRLAGITEAVAGKTRPKRWTQASWAAFWHQLARNGELPRSVLAEFIGRSERQAQLAVPADLPPLVFNTWMERDHDFLESLFEAEFVELKRVGLDTETGSLHLSQIWQDSEWADCKELSVLRDILQPEILANVSKQDLAELDERFELQWQALLSKSLNENFTKLIRRSGFVRLRWEEEYDGPEISLEQMFYAAGMSESMPFIAYFNNVNEPVLYKMLSKNGKVVVSPDDFKRYQRISFPKQESCLLIYAPLHIETEPVVRIQLTASKITWAAERLSTAVLFSEQQARDLGLKLIQHVMPMLRSNFNSDARWVPGSTLWVAELNLDQPQERLRSTRQTTFIESLDNWGYPMARGALIYKRVSDFGVSRPADAWIFEQLRAHRSAQSIVNDLVKQFPEYDVESAMRRVIDIENTPEEAFNKPVVLDWSNPGEFQLFYASNPKQFEQIRQFGFAIWQSLFPKLAGAHSNEWLDAVCTNAHKTAIDDQPPPIKSTNYLDDLNDFLGETSEVPSDARGAEALPPTDVVRTDPNSTDVELVDGNKSTHNVLNNRLVAHDPDRFNYSVNDAPGVKRYSSICMQSMQPVVYSKTEWAEMRADPAKTAFLQRYESEPEMVLYDPKANNNYICPEFFCIRDKLPLMTEDLLAGACPVCAGKIIPKTLSANAYRDRKDQFTVLSREAASLWPRWDKKRVNPRNQLELPCCFKTFKPHGETAVKRLVDASESALYVLGADRFPLPPTRFGLLPQALEVFLGISTTFPDPQMKILKPGTGALLRYGPANERTAVFDTLKRVIGRGDAALAVSLDEFQSLNNGNLVRIYASRDFPDAQPDGFPTSRAWNLANWRVFSAWQAFSAALKTPDTLPFSHIWDLAQRKGKIHIIVWNISDTGDVLAKCPPFGVEPPSDETLPLCMFFEAGCVWEPIAWVQREKLAMTPTFVFSLEDLRARGVDLVLPDAFLKGSCRRAPENYVRPPRFGEIAAAATPTSLVLDQWGKVIAWREAAGPVYPVYASALPADLLSGVLLKFGWDPLPEWQAEWTALKAWSDAHRVPAMAPARLIAYAGSEPPTVIAVETRGLLRVPVQPAAASDKYPTLLTYSSWTGADYAWQDNQQASPQTANPLGDIETAEAVREWVLFALSKYIAKKDWTEDLALDFLKGPKLLEWLEKNVLVGAPPTEIPKFKRVCEASADETCDSMCVINGGTCKHRSTVSYKDLIQSVRAALAIPQKRDWLLNDTYPPIDSRIYWTKPNEQIFSSNDVLIDAGVYPAWTCATCSNKQIFD